MKMSDRRIIPVVAAVIVHKGRILAAKRKPVGPSGGKWEFAGGKLEAGETPAQALVREIREELGLDIRVGAELGCYTTALDPYIIELQCFWCDLLGGNLALSDHDEVRWCSHEEMRKLDWALPDLPAVEAVLSWAALKETTNS